MKRLIFLLLLICGLAFMNVGCSDLNPETTDQVGDDGNGGGNGSGSDNGNGTGNIDQEIPEGFEDEADDPSADPVRTFDYSKAKAAGHPRLLCDAQGFKTLKTKVTSGRFQNKTLYKLHQEALARAEMVIKADRTFASADEHVKIVDNLLTCTYAYKMTGQSAYLIKVQKDMRTVCGFANWNPSGLSIGEISFAMAIAYDWLYYDLPLDLRKLARQSMGTKGVRPMYNKSFAKTIGNWNSICLGGVACASLAIYEKDKTAAVNQIEKAIQENTIGVTGMYSPNGNYGEGIGYWEYGGGYQVCFLSALEGIFGNTAGIAEIPGFMESGEYALFMHGTKNTSFSYSDGGGTTDPILLTSWWYAAQHDNPDLIYCEKRRVELGDYTGSALTSEGFRMLVPILVQLRDFDMESRPANPPTKEIWHGKGEMHVAMVRKGWKFDGTDVYLGVKGGLCDSWLTSNTSHAHMDAGSFVFEAEGVRWSNDCMRPSYGNWFAALKNSGSRSGDTSQSGLRWDTFKVNNLCHSTIVSFTNDGTIRNKLHDNDFYVGGFATIDEIIDAGDRQGAIVDMSGPMRGQVAAAKRAVEVVNGTDLVVTDEITALQDLDCKLEWRMLSESSVSAQTDKVVLTKDGKTRNLTVTSSDASVTPLYKRWSASRPGTDYWKPAAEMGWKDMSWDSGVSNNAIAGWQATVPKGKTVRFVTTLKK